jgi:hypothetical protein
MMLSRSYMEGEKTSHSPCVIIWCVCGVRYDSNMRDQRSESFFLREQAINFGFMDEDDFGE